MLDNRNVGYAPNTRAVTHPRNSSFEILRIIAALMIIARHMVSQNELIVFEQQLSWSKVICQSVIYGGGKVAVVLFISISAWFICQKSQSIKDSLRHIWILERELLFYSLLIGLLTFVLNREEFTAKLAMKSVLPLSAELWWYPTSYAVFMLLVPFIRQGLLALGERRHRQACVVILAWWVASGILPGISLDIDPESFTSFIGYFTFVSYACWYGRVPSTRKCWIMSLVGIGLSVVSVLAVELLAAMFPSLAHELLSHETFMSEDEWMPPVALAGLGIFFLFTKLEFSNRAINRLASCALASYLISQHPVVAKWLWKSPFSLEPVWGSLLVLPFILTAALTIYMVCYLIDEIRRIIFRITIDRNRGLCFTKFWEAIREFCSVRGLLG